MVVYDHKYRITFIFGALVIFRSCVFLYRVAIVHIIEREREYVF